MVALVAFSFFISSCQTQTVTSEKTVTTVMQTGDNPGTDGFILKVKKGDTVWDFSQKVYGTGFKWRDIVAQNQFLNEPGRVEKKGDKWIVLIYPGEEIRIGDKVITTNGYGQIIETTATTVKTTGPTTPSWPWYWFAVAIVALCLATTFLVILIIHFINRGHRNRHMDIGNNIGDSISLQLVREERAVLQDMYNNGRSKSFQYKGSAFSLSGEFYPQE